MKLLLAPYKTLFVIIFKSLKTIEGGWAYQTDKNRAFETVIIISVFLLVNAYLILPNAVKGTYSWVFIISCIVNTLFFLPKNRYLRFLEEFKSLQFRGLFSTVVIIYVILTLLSLFFYR